MELATGTSTHRVRAVKIEETSQVTPTIRSFLLRDELCARAHAGQFAMIWIPGADEVPMSILPLPTQHAIRIALKPWGGGSSILYNRRGGIRVGVRGPYGKGFTIPERGRVMLVGGGTGIVPLLALLNDMDTSKVDCKFVFGARSSTELPFLEEAIARVGKDRVYVTTDDGSAGVKGVVTDVSLRILNDENFDALYTCGPEIMMRILFDESRKRGIRFEAAVEREFACGVGYCGICRFGEYLVCVDGPVFDGERLAKIEEFGERKRDASGKYVPS